MTTQTSSSYTCSGGLHVSVRGDEELESTKIVWPSVTYHENR